MCGCLKQRRVPNSALTQVYFMKYFYWFIAAALIVTVLSVLFVPGVDDHVERVFQIYVGRAAT